MFPELGTELTEFLLAEGADVEIVKQAPAIRPQRTDRSHPLTAYFISSSHNTYLLSSQLLGKSSAQAYRDAIQQNARCVEMDVWSLQSSSSMFNVSTSKAASGLVLTHGYTFSQAISLESVVETINQTIITQESSGEPVSPVFVSLECHVPVNEQDKLVNVMKEGWGDRLVSAPLSGADPPPLEAFLGKILVMVEYYPPAPAQGGGDSSSSSEDDSSDVSDEEHPNAPRKKPPHPKITDGLASIGYYARSMKPHHNWLEHVFPPSAPKNILINISEPALLALLPQSLDALIQNSHKYLRRIYPKGTRVHSSNLDPLNFWGSGAQVVSLNWQKYDRGMQMNQAMFESSSGWVLKPRYLREHYDPSSFTPKTKTFSIQIAGISGLYPPSDCREPGKSYHVYLVAQLFQPCTIKSAARTQQWKSKKIKTTTLPEGSAATVMWKESFQFSYEVNLEGQEELMFLRFRVKESELGKDDVLAVYPARLDLLASPAESDKSTQGWKTLKMMGLEGTWGGACLVVKVTSGET